MKRKVNCKTARALRLLRVKQLIGQERRFGGFTRFSTVPDILRGPFFTVLEWKISFDSGSSDMLDCVVCSTGAPL